MIRPRHALSCGCRRCLAWWESEDAAEIQTRTCKVRQPYLLTDIVIAGESRTLMARRVFCGQVWCPKCELYKEPSAFAVNTGRVASRCRQCGTEYQTKRMYGVVIRDIRERSCEICGENRPRMAHDHDHDSGEFRGVLCTSCNSGLGHFRDNIISLRKAADYLERKAA